MFSFVVKIVCFQPGKQSYFLLSFVG